MPIHRGVAGCLLIWKPPKFLTVILSMPASAPDAGIASEEWRVVQTLGSVALPPLTSGVFFDQRFLYTRSMRTLFKVTGVFGRSPESRGALDILSATSCPSTTSPKIVCLLSSHGVAATVIKNWLPLVPGPELAIDNFPALECFREG